MPSCMRHIGAGIAGFWGAWWGPCIPLDSSSCVRRYEGDLGRDEPYRHGQAKVQCVGLEVVGEVGLAGRSVAGDCRNHVDRMVSASRL